MSYTRIMSEDRTEFFTDMDGLTCALQDQDEVKAYIFDYTEELDSGETISSQTTTSEGGPVVDSSALATPQVTMTLSKSGGTVKNTIVTSNSRTIVRRLRLISHSR